jgi:prepilin signal peptidase PulO-like enzyme (type II secretory pathway)
MEIIIAALIGVLVGILINVLADELPYRAYITSPIALPDEPTDEDKIEFERLKGVIARRNWRGFVPTYPDGTPRPISAWLGLLAFALGQREPKEAKPDEERSRPHVEGNKLEWRHPLTELMTGLFFALAAWAAPNIVGMNPAQYTLNFVYMAIFALIIVIDMEHKLILFVVMIPAIAIGLLDAFFLPEPKPLFNDALIGAVFGFVFFFLIYLGGYAFRWYINKYRGGKIRTVPFGYGDVMMITFSGAILGTLYTVMAIFLTTALGAIGAFIYLMIQRALRGRYQAFTAIPYGPYIVIATLLMLLWGAQIWDMLY